MRRIQGGSLVAIPVLVAALALPGSSVAKPPDARSGIAWQVASSDAEVDRAFALARQSGKPVFLYWGAVWCPPCNQVKATLFSRPDFVERSRNFVPVYVDGDKPGAQKVASRFKVTGYPTMVVFRPDGSEVTRLPGEVDAERYMMTLAAGLEAQTPVRELVQRALARQPLTVEQWRLLAFYSWDTDQEQSKVGDLASRLSELGAAAPAQPAGIRDRLLLKAIATRARDPKQLDERIRGEDRAVIERFLASDEATREHWDLLVFYASALTKYLEPEAGGRAELAARWDRALEKLLVPGALSNSATVDAWDARVNVWKAMERSDQLPPERRETVRAEMARVVAATRDRYERQAVVPSAAHVLASAGHVQLSDEMLKAELPRAVAPYYHMLVLGSNAKKRGDKAEALRWYEQAWRQSEGPATRLQWGAGFVRELVTLTPEDSQRIASTASAIVGGLQPRGETFYERSQRSLERMASHLVKWQGSDPARARVVAQVKGQLTRTCSKLPAKDPGRANCEKVFAAAAAKGES